LYVYLIEKTIEFDMWLKKLRDKTARAKILFRLQRVELGNLMMKSSKFDIAEYLDDQEMINEYLNTVLEEGDSNDIQVALGHIAKAIGMSKIAEQTGMSRPSLYKALAENAKPQFDTILKVLRAIGGNIKMKPSI
jgi:probable addiction module antidote protein